MRAGPARHAAWLLAGLAMLALPMHAQELPSLQVAPDLISPTPGKPPPPPPASAGSFSKEQIEQLVAPIALYPDPLFAQVLMASTYPLEVVQAARWAQNKENAKLKDKALEDAMQKQPWDASVKSLTAVPQVLAMMNEKLDWMQQLGDAFLAQQKEVMDAAQRLRAKAQEAGNLKSGKEQKVTDAQEDGAKVIKIESTDPQVVYVPVYNPMVIYGPWPYAMYPPYYYYPPAYAGGVFFAFSVGIVVGSAMWGGCHWGGGGVYINHNTYNNFNRTNINNGNWQHRPEHRQGVQYRDQGSREKFGGQRPSAGTHDDFRGRGDGGQRDRDVGGGGNRDIGGGNRDIGGGGRGGSGAFDGVGNGAQTRDYSNRGASSRASSGGFGGGGGRAGGGGRGGGGRR